MTRLIILKMSAQALQWYLMRAAAIHELSDEVMAFEEGLLADALSRGDQHGCMSAAFILL